MDNTEKNNIKKKNIFSRKDSIKKLEIINNILQKIFASTYFIFESLKEHNSFQKELFFLETIISKIETINYAISKYKINDAYIILFNIWDLLYLYLIETIKKEEIVIFDKKFILTKNLNHNVSNIGNFFANYCKTEFDNFIPIEEIQKKHSEINSSFRPTTTRGLINKYTPSIVFDELFSEFNKDLNFIFDWFFLVLFKSNKYLFIDIISFFTNKNSLDKKSINDFFYDYKKYTKNKKIALYIEKKLNHLDEKEINFKKS